MLAETLPHVERVVLDQFQEDENGEAEHSHPPRG